MSFGRYYARLDDTAVTAAKTLVELTAPATAILEIVRIRITSSATASENSTVKFERKSAAGTGTAFTPQPVAAGYAAAGTTARVNLTAEGTVASTQHVDAFNLVSGYEWVALDEAGRIVVPPSGVFGVRLNTAPAASKNFSALIEVIEKG